MGQLDARITRDAVSDSALPLIGIYEISKVLGATLDLNRALHDVLNILSSYLHLRHGTVVLHMPDQDQAEIAAVAGMSLTLARSGELNYPMGLVRRVIQTGIPAVIPDATDDPELLVFLESLGEDEGASFFSVPVKTSGKPFGALTVDRGWDGRPRPVFEHDLRFLSMVATLIGQAVSLNQKVTADRNRLLEQSAHISKSMDEIKPSLPVQGLEDIVGNSQSMARVFAQVQQAAPTKATILLRGESGTGKEMIARAVHVLSNRSDKPFIKVNCAALAESVLESELFGHEKGAFTGAATDRKGRFELAHGGTLFLDEIGEISASFQAKLLRVLQEGEFERVGGTKTIKVDVRLVAATNRDLENAVKKNEFRADLYYRLNVVPIFLPPLRERQGDIPLLAMYFLKRFNEENGRNLTFSEKALKSVQCCTFPGNVRELENCVTRTATMASGPVIQDLDLSCRKDRCLSQALGAGLAPIMPVVPAPPAPAPQPTSPQPISHPTPPLDADGDLVDRDRLIAAMEQCGWVQAKASRLLGLTPRQIGYALRKYNIEIKQI